MSESLFSLEVVINYVKILHEKSVSCLFPCIAFRLLDYPTIAIHFLDDIDARQLKQQHEMNQGYQPDLKTLYFRDLLDKHGRYIFAKGKSCLFRAELSVLRGHLRNAPLYVMLLDTYEEPYKLVGSSAVALTNVIEEMCAEIRETSIDMPCTRITHGVFDIKNLMGEEIGHISFACRLSSFGSTLLPHIGVTPEAIERQSQLKKINKNQTSTPIKEDMVVEKKREVEKNVVNTLVQTVPIDYKVAQIQISTPEKVDNGTEMEVERKQFVQNYTEIKPKTKKVVEDEFVFNHYCPPPLHYNSEKNVTTTTTTRTVKTETSTKMATSIAQNIKVIKERKQVINEYEKQRIEYLNEAVNNQVELELFEEDHEAEDGVEDEDEGYISQKQETNQKQLKQRSNSVMSKPTSNNFDLNNFPILKSLIDEISKLQNLQSNDIPSNPRSKSARPKSALPAHNQRIHSKSAFVVDYPREQNLIGILKDRNKIQQRPKMNKEEITKSVNRLSTPRTPHVEVDKQNKQEEKQEGREEKKAKLKYGTTKAYKMRIQLSRADKKVEKNDKDEDDSWLIKKLNENLTADDMTASSQSTTPRLSVNKRGQKSSPLNKEDSSPPLNHMSISNSTYNGSRSPLDLSLLNKVEMESTIDYALSRNIFNLNKNSNSNENNQMLKNSLQQSGSGGQNTKFVQFGNTYVHQPSDDSSATHTKTTTTTNQTSTSTNSLGNKVVKIASTSSPIKNKKSPRSQASSVSSSKQSSKTSDDFEEDEDISIKLNKINFNKDDLDLYGSSSKYSSNDFCTETSKSKDILEEEEDEEEEENFFSRDSRTSTN